MKKTLTILSLFLASSLALAAAEKTTDWKEISDDDGIKVFSREIEGSDLIAFKGEAIVDASVAKVSSVLMDSSRKTEWVSRAIEARDLRQISTYERVEYNATASGFFLVKDRDFVFNAKAEFDKPNKRVIYILKSVEDPAAPETSRVRGHLHYSNYVLTSIEGGKKTHLIVEINADPKGSVPRWLVNLIQKSWPRKTIQGIQKQAARADVVEHAGIKKLLE